MLELPEHIKREDIKQLKLLLPQASDCFLASLLPLNHMFSVHPDRSQKSQSAMCQCLRHFFEQTRQLESHGKKTAFSSNANTVIIDTKLAAPGEHTLKSYRDKIEKNF